MIRCGHCKTTPCSCEGEEIAAAGLAADDYSAIRRNADRLASDKASAEAMLRLKDQLRDSEPQPTMTAGGVFSQAKPTLPDGRTKQPLVDTPGMAGNPLKDAVDGALSRRTYDRLSSVETAGRGVAPEVGTDPPPKATQENATFTDENLAGTVLDGGTVRIPALGILKNPPIPEVEDITVYPIEYGFAVMVREGVQGVALIRADGRHVRDMDALELLDRCKRIRERWPSESAVNLFQVVAEQMGGWVEVHNSHMSGSINVAVKEALRGVTATRVKGDNSSDVATVRHQALVDEAKRGIAMTMACQLNAGLMRKLDEVIEDADRILEWLQTGV